MIGDSDYCAESTGKKDISVGNSGGFSGGTFY